MARGHLTKRGESGWTIVIELPRDADGKRRQKWISNKGNRKQAEIELTRLQAQVDQGAFVEPHKETMAKFMDRWVDTYARTNVAPSTLRGYQGSIRRYIVPAFGHVPVQRLMPRHLQELYAQLGQRGLSPRTIVQVHRVLHEALGHGVKWGLLSRNVASAVDPPKPGRPELTILDSGSVQRVLEAAKGSTWEVPMTLAVLTGLRRAELLGLKWADVDMEKGYLSVVRTLQRVDGKLVDLEPKTARSRRRVALAPAAIGILRQHKARQLEGRLRLGGLYQNRGYLFTSPMGDPIEPNSITAAFRRFAGHVDLDGARFHDLRHAHASLLLREGVHPKIVSERLGHASIGITLDTYSHVLPGLQEEAATVLERSLGLSALAIG